MKTIIAATAVLLFVAGCGVETVGTAATAAAAKKQEAEQAKRTMDDFQKKLGQAQEQAAARNEAAEKQQ